MLQEWNKKEKKQAKKESHISKKINSQPFLQSNADKTVKNKVIIFIELENNSMNAQQIANGYFYKWKKTKEENDRLLYSATVVEN